jgi:hypothetical protein
MHVSLGGTIKEQSMTSNNAINDYNMAFSDWLLTSDPPILIAKITRHA